MSSSQQSAFPPDAGSASKVPEVTFGFWIVKILATTLGETGGDAASMSLNLGYAVSSALLVVVFLVAVAAQMRAKAFHPALYWAVVIATTTAGTTLADLADRSLRIGYPGGSAILAVLLAASLFVWYRAAGSIAVHTVKSPRIEVFYWVAILFSQTLGTALGDWIADTNGLGYERGAFVFGAGLAVVAGMYFFTNVSRTALFWAAFVMTRPLGATLGDLLDKPVANGGFAVSRFTASALLLVAVALCLALLPQRPERASLDSQERVR